MGLATNSSSSHSILISPTKEIDRSVEDNEFGWDKFVCSSTQSKMAYLNILVRHNLTRIMGDDYATMVANSLTGTSVKDGYIDHQSVYVLPTYKEYGKTYLNKEFIDDLIKYLSNEKITILGGNDNEENHHIPGSFRLPLQQDSDGELRARKDGNYWTIFNQNNGTKIRFSFCNDGSIDPISSPVKSTYPELVDIKITDFCDIGCGYCYQGSTIKGEHADRDLIQQISYVLKDMSVFEVAIGGGETTTHPRFIDILRNFKDNDIVPNFTTRSMEWLKNKEARDEILGICGAFAFSCDNDYQVLSVLSMIEANEVPMEKCSIQYVMGCSDLGTLEKILNLCETFGARITLLGYKTTGRGSKYKPEDYSNWLDVVLKFKEKNPYFRDICIDTALAKQYEKQLLDKGIPKETFHVQEGKFSMYVDAVTRKCGPSSYCDESEMVKLGDRQYMKEKLIAAYTQF